MTAVPPLEAVHQPAEERKTAKKFNYYPLLGVLLAIVMAALAYGGLLLFLVDDWTFFQFGEPAEARKSAH